MPVSNGQILKRLDISNPGLYGGMTRKLFMYSYASSPCHSVFRHRRFLKPVDRKAAAMAALVLDFTGFL
jgi:hypothetical protein